MRPVTVSTEVGEKPRAMATFVAAERKITKCMHGRAHVTLAPGRHGKRLMQMLESITAAATRLATLSVEPGALHVRSVTIITPQSPKYARVVPMQSLRPTTMSHSSG